MRIWEFSILAFFILVAVTIGRISLSADGDAVSSADVTKGSYTSSTFLMCDADSDSTTCGEIDLNDSGKGMPDYMIISRDKTTDCSGNVTVTIQGQTISGGTEHTIGTLNDATTSVRIAAPRNRFIDADLANMTACSDMDVNITLFYERD
jgi:hypothetical protein